MSATGPRTRAFLLGLSGLLWATPGAAQTPIDWSTKVTRREAMIPMRDGIKLHTEIYTPKGHPEAMPFIMTRTPYGLLFGVDKKGFSNRLANTRELIDDGFIIVLQDIRGKSRSTKNSWAPARCDWHASRRTITS